MVLRLAFLVAGIWLVGTGNAHTIITSPGWRGNNLITNDTWPYGMQWMYPVSIFILTFL
jgi:hypothetical protein